MDAANAGDAQAFETLYERHKDWALALALRFSGDSSDAADAVQETFLHLLGRFPGFELRARMTTFLYPIVRHAALAARRRRGRFATDESALSAAPASADDGGVEGREELLAALAGLPEPQREVLLLRYAHGLDEAEIAELLDIPAGTVKSRAHHALRTLRADPRMRGRFPEDR